MLHSRLALYLMGAAVYLAVPPTPLRVVRVTPTDDVDPTTSITVSFDRPVAGSLDRTVDAKSIVRIAPSAVGKVEWRDPVTIVFTPAQPLRADTRYTVTVGNSFKAMDGSALGAPYAFSFRVRGPTLVGGSPASASVAPEYLVPEQTFTLVYSAPFEPAKLAAAAYIELSPSCGGARVVRFARVQPKDLDAVPPRGRSVTSDTTRAAFELTPAAPLPLGCRGVLVAPTEIASTPHPLARWAFGTHGDLRLARAECASNGACPTGPLRVTFATPVRGAEVMRHVRLFPAAPFTVRDTTEESDAFVLEAELKPRTTYAVVADTALHDVFGQPLRGNPAVGFTTTGYEPNISYPYGRLTVERSGFGTLAVRHVNVDTLVVLAAPVPDSLEGAFMRRSQWSMGDLWDKVKGKAVVSRIPVHAARDLMAVTGIKVPTTDGTRRPTLWAMTVRPTHPDSQTQRWPAIAVVQVTDLGVHARIGAESGVVWVTGAQDGKARPGATVTLFRYDGKPVATATTDARGLALLSGFHGEPAARADAVDDSDDEGEGEGGYQAFQGYVSVTLGADRALTGVSDYDPDLSPWRFNVTPAWGSDRVPLAGAVFTERGIYRPGERVWAKAIVRSGTLGALTVPTRGDSLRWLFRNRDQGTMRDTTVALSAFGTADCSLALPADAPLGTYALSIQTKRSGQWIDVGSTSYRVAEYRPPEFLVELASEKAPRFAGDSVRATVQARYLFGAPMGRAAVRWQAWQTPAYGWESEIPNTDGYFIGDNGWWWEDDDWSGAPGNATVFTTGTDTLDATGQLALRVSAPRPEKGRPSRLTISAAVQDVNRQTVGAQTSVVVHPASFYIGAKPVGASYFWTEGKPQSLAIIAVRPAGELVPGVKVRGVVVRREWHQVHVERGGVADLQGEWVSDTVARCDVVTGAVPASCTITPKSGGTYLVTLRATDETGREATTSLYRWTVGKEWVPWNDESRLKVDVIADKSRYAVGDTATVLFASPFTGAEAWITIEREGLIEQRRMTLTSGTTTLKLPIPESYAPNVFVSIFIARGRSAPPGRLDDPGRPTIRVGYTELRVTPEVKRLNVDLALSAVGQGRAPSAEHRAPEFRPGDTARVGVHVRDAAGAGKRAEVTLWAVDEGVLALTGYKTPDPLDLLYRPRGLGLRLASNLSSVAPQIPEGEKGSRAPGGGGGADRADILRSRFQTTAFFLGSVVTDANGNATASVKLPDNLTTFRLMAVAVTADDRYGKGEAPLLVTRPLLARAALPRFVRPGDVLSAGAVINQRAGGTPTVRVDASANGIELRGARTRTTTLEAGRGREVRFDFRAIPGDSATFRFGVTGGADADAVQAKIPVRPVYAPRSVTVAGVLRDSAATEIALPAGLDPARSTVTFSLGSTPAAVLKGLYAGFHVYPYYCSEQVTSVAQPLLALYRNESDSARHARARRELERAVSMLSSRQRTDGGIGYWHAGDWTSPWLTTYAATFLFEARAAGLAVNDSVLARAAEYLQREVRDAGQPRLVPVANWYEDGRTSLADRVAAADFLSRMGRPDIAAENVLLSQAAQLWWDDRLRLAEVLARRGARNEALALVAPAWGRVRLDGNRAVLPGEWNHDFYFRSDIAPMARLLTATLATNPTHPLVGPMVETLLAYRRGDPWGWNTHDAGAVAVALADFERRQQHAADQGIRVRASGRVLFATGATRAGDSTVALAGLLADAPGGAKTLRLTLDTPAKGGLAYYYITVAQVPLARPVTPEDAGVRVERWYERYDTHQPITSIAEGELVRVRMRVTVDAERHFLVLDDPLPAGLEAVDLSLATTAALPGPGANLQRTSDDQDEEGADQAPYRWWYGSWDDGWWTPWDHKEIRDDRVVYVATYLWPGTYTATYVARATTPGVFVRPPAQAQEMYNPGVNGRSDGGLFTVVAKQ